MGDVIGALREIAKDGLCGEAELACAEVGLNLRVDIHSSLRL